MLHHTRLLPILIMILLVTLLGLGVWLMVMDDNFVDDAILTPVATPSTTPQAEPAATSSTT